VLILYHLAIFEANKHPDLHLLAIAKLIIGVALCFFGGYFSSLVAVVEAFSQGGGRQVMQNLRTLHEAIHPAKIRDQTTNIRTAMRVSDPQLVQQSVLAVYTACTSALVAVKLKNGRLFTLGSSIGEHIDRPAQKYIVPSLVHHASTEASTWIPMAVHLICRFAGVLLSYPVQLYLGILATAVRGGHYIMDSVTELLTARGVDMNFSQVILDDLLVGGVVALGLSFQLAHVLPFFVKLVLSPALAAEYVLTTAIEIV